MRLTLRTMLAYLDDLLAPQDTEDIARKIEESEFATELVHRTRDCMRRLRLGVPPVDGKGLASDPNTVADYLDNTLSADRVAEFEKICLESDVHLAEVASCHQILTLVLGEPAEIDQASRQRMYRIASEATAEAASPVAAPPVQPETVQPAASAAPTTPPTPPRRPKPEVPDYLREPRSRLWPVAAAAVGGAIVTVGLLLAFGPAELRQRVVGDSAADQSTADDESAQSETRPTAEQPDVDQPAPQEPGEAAPSDPDEESPAAPEATSPPATDLQLPENAPAIDADAPAAPKPTDVPADMPEKESPPPSAGDATARPSPSDDSPLPAAAPDKPEPGADTTDRPTEPAPAEPEAAQPKGAEAADDGFGRYTSKGGEVLLRFDRQNGDWMRLPAMSPLAKGDRLLSLPLYRPTIALSTSISIQPDGACKLELVGWTPEGVPILSVEYGRLLMMTVGKAGNAVALQLGESRVELTFVDAESTVALEARRILPPGKDPMQTPAPLAVDLYAISGSVRARTDDGPPLDVQAPARRALVGEGIAPLGEVPAWVTSEARSNFEHQATTTLEPMLPADQFVGLILKELANHRKWDVRSLAIRSATYLDNFDPCIEALNEKDEKNSWTAYIESLRDAIARSPETASRVRNTLDKLKGADGEGLFRMLWGYSGEDLQNGAAAELVDGLSHDSLDFRVVTIWALQQITGPANHGYYPENLAKARTTSVKTWKELLRRGKIVPTAVTKATGPRSSSSKAK